MYLLLTWRRRRGEGEGLELVKVVAEGHGQDVFPPTQSTKQGKRSCSKFLCMGKRKNNGLRERVTSSCSICVCSIATSMKL